MADRVMRKYPEEITERVLAINAHLPTWEVERDAAETEREIESYEALANAQDVIRTEHPDQQERRMADFRASAYRSVNTDRRNFVAFLRRLLAARTERADIEAAASVEG